MIPDSEVYYPWKNKTEWISVKDRIPEPDTTFVLVSDGESVGVSFPVEDERGDIFFDMEWGDLFSRYITHWMPLPEPPEGE